MTLFCISTLLGTPRGREFERKSISTTRFAANNDAGMAGDATLDREQAPATGEQQHSPRHGRFCPVLAGQAAERPGDPVAGSGGGVAKRGPSPVLGLLMIIEDY